VAGIAEAIVEVGGNIIELSSRLVERDGRSGYVLRLSVAVPAGVTAETLEGVISTASERLGVSSSVTAGAGDLP
jgi:hypothetical protein